jgi:hypothetical protein
MSSALRNIAGANVKFTKENETTHAFRIFTGGGGEPGDECVAAGGSRVAEGRLSREVVFMALRMKKGSVPRQLQGVQFLDLKLFSFSFGYCSSFKMEYNLPELRKIVEECMPCKTHGCGGPLVAPPARQPPPLVCWLFKRGCNLKSVRMEDLSGIW